MIVVAVFALAVLAAVLFFLAKGAISDDKHEEVRLFRAVNLLAMVSITRRLSAVS